MPTTPNSMHDTPAEAEFNVDTEMKDVEILHVSSSRVLARGRRYGRLWLLRGLPPEQRRNPELLRELREEFDRRFGCLRPDEPLTVGIEEIKGLGPCIVEEWREDSIREESGKVGARKRKPPLRKAFTLGAALIMLVGVIAGGLYLLSLSVASENAKADLETLRMAHSRGEERMFMLADSLEKVLNGPLIPDDYGQTLEIWEPDEEEKKTLALYKMRTDEFDREFVRYDRHVMPQVIDSLPLFYDSICALYRHMLAICDNVDPDRRFPELPEDDRIRLMVQLNRGWMVRLQGYSKVWMPKAWAADKAKREKDNPDRENKPK